MPELPEVETIARELDAALRDRCFGRAVVRRKDVIHGDPRPVAALLTGRCVERVRRRAKRVIVEMSSGTQAIFHLGMSGRLTLSSRNEPAEPHTHLALAIRGTDMELRFRDPRRFGGLWIVADGGKHVGRPLGPLGPEPLTLRTLQFARLLERRRAIKALLLDQAVIAGLGNIYCDESLHAAGVHPLVRADSLDREKAKRLLTAIKKTLRKAIRYKGTTLLDYRRADGTAGSFRRHHHVYQRAGEQCRTCGDVITRIVVASRSTFVCPTCQPPPKSP